ncbi:putative NLR family CARD domain-containing protein 4 [Apostichopus japonicus]|uniref:Putative NLR family CARD domain-containing protein 4 n=1 Tax=Stichopus japonicus TaxID=307972 RepID=A0A2G8KKK6_STIJA|nr:putative NLR family CARD domain-containing protein 4 [Apostichopus japonicus]
MIHINRPKALVFYRNTKEYHGTDCIETWLTNQWKIFDDIAYTMGLLILQLFWLILSLPCTIGDECEPIQYLEYGEMNTLRCSFGADIYSVIWYDSVDYITTKPIAVLQEHNIIDDGGLSDDYNITLDGSLIINTVSLIHEHEFVAVLFEQEGAEPSLHYIDVVVTVTPYPDFPVIDICGNSTSLCFTELKQNDVITCSVQNARPKVSLQWLERTETGDSYIETQTEDIMHQTLTFSSYSTLNTVSPQPSHPVVDGCSEEKYCVIEAQTEGTLSCSLFGVSPVVDLSFRAFNPSDKSKISFFEKLKVTNKGETFDIVLTATYELHGTSDARFTIECGTHTNEDTPLDWSKKFDMILISVKKRQKQKEVTESHNEEMEYMIPQHLSDEELSEGAIEISTTGTRGRKVWKRLKSYHEILNKNLVHSKVRVIFGDPGYGKSTLCIQMVHDWCKRVVSSPLADVEFVIFIRFRQLGSIKSLFEAIKLFLLPIDSELSVTDIESIIRRSTSTLVIFDGYDEIDEKANFLMSDIKSIIERTMLQVCNNCYNKERIVYQRKLHHHHYTLG